MTPELLQFVPYLGRTSADPELVELVQTLGYALTLASEAGDNTVNLCMKGQGIELHFIQEGDSFVFRGADFFAADVEGYRQFPGPLPHGLSFTMTRAEVRSTLGQPAKSGGGKKFRTFTSKEWDGYFFDQYYLAAFYNQATGAVGSFVIALLSTIKR